MSADRTENDHDFSERDAELPLESDFLGISFCGKRDPAMDSDWLK